MKMFEWLKKNNTRVKDIRYAIDSVNNIKALEQRKSKLKEEVQSIKEERDYLLDNLGDIKKEHVVEYPLNTLLKEGLIYLYFINSITAYLGSMLFSFRISNSFSGSLAL